MKQLLMIPDINRLEESLELAEKYNLGFEYNDFFHPAILDDEQRIKQICDTYQKHIIPKYSTMHGAFLDVIPCSPDEKIRKVSGERIEQSIKVAEKIGASAVVFHTNYNPFLNTPAYVEQWIEQNVAFWSQVLESHPGISIYLENMFDVSPDMLQEVSGKLCRYKNYGVCLDYAHAALSKESLQVWVETLGRYVKHIHINDNDLVSDLHLAWGSGAIDRELFYHSYETYMKDATILIETSSIENVQDSLKVLAEDGFLRNHCVER